MPCDACKRDIPTIAKGLCAACYQRQWKTGSTEYQRLGRVTPCQINGCTDRAVSHGYCDKHRQRLASHGHTALKHDSWGAKSKHPLKNAWGHLRRYRAAESVCPEWRDDFLQFINDIGERPSPKHKLYAADDSQPIGPTNFVWKRSFTERVEGEAENTYRARRARANRSVNPEMFKKHDLKRNYGLTADEFAKLHEAQQGRCAICGLEESRIIRGKNIALSVDHCHRSGKVRQLLCTACNTGIGSFKEDLSLMRRAIAYLERHAEPPPIND